MQKRLKATVACLTAKIPTQLKRAIYTRTHAPTPQPAAAESVESSAKQDSAALEGKFWSASEPERRCPGELIVREGTDAKLKTTGSLVDMRAFSMTILENGLVEWTQSEDPADVVADFSPITIHGVLDTGREITLVDAMGTAGPDFQSFRVRYVLDGAHVDGHEERFSAVRFQLDDPWWWAHLKDGMSAQAGAVGSLSISRDGQSVWFVFESAEPMTLRECDSLVISPVLTLTRLAFDVDLGIGPTQLRVDPATSPWISVLTKRRSLEPVRRTKLPTDLLLPKSVLGIDNFATWIALSVDLDGLAAVVAHPPKGVAIQAKALTMAAVTEGLHRRLFSGTKRFQSLGPAQRRKVRNDAIDAGTKAFEIAGYPDLVEARDALTEALGHLSDVSYLSRLRELEKDATEVVPQVTAEFPNDSWGPLVVKTRNLLAHQLSNDKRVMLEKIDAMTLVTWSLPWVLRIVLLRQARVEPKIIRECFAEFSAFQYYQANVAAVQADSQR